METLHLISLSAQYIIISAPTYLTHVCITSSGAVHCFRADEQVCCHRKTLLPVNTQEDYLQTSCGPVKITGFGMIRHD